MMFQLQLTKCQTVVPNTRDYITRETSRLAALEWKLNRQRNG
jgi:hypothetical protein